MKVKVITLWQPWASAFVLGIKAVETRHWKTDFIGELWIHSAKRFPSKSELDFCRQTPRSIFDAAIPDITSVPYGYIIGRVNITGCLGTHSEEMKEWCAKNFGIGEAGSARYMQEFYLGNHGVDRFAWTTDLCPQILETPIPAVGQQGFFTYDIPDNHKLIIPPKLYM